MVTNPMSARTGRFALALVCAAAVLCGAALVAYAQSGKGMVIIRDTEIESILKGWAEPVIKAASLDPDSVNIILVQNDNINAFVAGGQNVFLYTGLLLKSNNAGEIVGVIAHELGHISGGHLVRSRDAMENASFESMVGSIVGIGAAILTGQGEAAAAIGAGTRATALNRFLSFSRVQESSADQAALSFMERAGLNPVGLKTFMQKLADQELLPASQQAEYVRTHPLTRDRVESLRAGHEKSAHAQSPFPAHWQEDHARLMAKLRGFIHPEQISWTYDERDQSIAARYARAIAAYRQNRIEEALTLVDGLLRDEPRNAYFHEIRGQMLMDFGRIAEAVPSYKEAAALQPDGALIRAAYGRALLENAGERRPQIEKAIGELRRASRDDPRSPSTHRLLATAYGRIGDEPMAKLHLAEEALLQRDKDKARTFATGAADSLKKGSPGWIRAQDILTYLETGEARKNDKTD